MKIRKYSDEQLAEAVRSSTSIRQVLRKIELVEAGGNYATVKRQINLLGIDTSHFTGMGHLKGKTHDWANKTPTSEILVEKSTFGGATSKLKARLIREGFFESKCYACKNTSWMGKPIPIELEHINGNRFDNRIENLTILCPNCHAQTTTYRGKNKQQRKENTPC